MSRQFAPGKSINNYRVLCTLGKGAYGSVLKVEEMTNKNVFAMKLAKASAGGKYGYDNEVQALKKLKGINGVPSVYDNFYSAGHWVIVIDLCFKDLHACRVDHPLHRFEKGTVITIGYHLYNILQKTHAKKLIHRDVKETNIMLKINPESKSMPICLADWGICIPLSKNNSSSIRDPTFMSCYYSTPAMVSGKTATRRDDCLMALYVLFDISGSLVFFPPSPSGFDAYMDKKSDFEVHPEKYTKESWLIDLAIAVTSTKGNQMPAYSKIKTILTNAKRSCDPSKNKLTLKKSGSKMYLK